MANDLVRFDPSIGDTIEVFKPEDDCYHFATIIEFDKTKHKYNYCVAYEDGLMEFLILSKEVWRYVFTEQTPHDNSLLPLEAPKEYCRNIDALSNGATKNKKTWILDDAITMLAHVITSWLRNKERAHMKITFTDIAALAIRNAIDRITMAAAKHDESMLGVPDKSANTLWLRGAYQFGVSIAVRENYWHWETAMTDSEWEVEQKALHFISCRIALAQRAVSEKKLKSTMLTAMAILFAAQ